MSDYEKRISFKTIWLTFVRRFKVILIIFLPISIASVIVCQFFITKVYQSSATFYCEYAFTPIKYPSVVAAVKSQTTAEKAASNLAVDDSSHKPVTHSNGSPITWQEIYDGIIIADYIQSNTGTVTFYFKSTDKAIVKPVLQEVAEIALPYAVSAFPGTKISSPASDAYKSSNETKYMLIGIVAGLVVSLALAFIDEIISDEVYDSDDIRYLGSPAFEITASK